jgi:asparagine synthase (glutamine-hydrolysing)
MAQAILHRGPDEDGFPERPGPALASRRLSLVGLASGRQPIANEGGTVQVVFNGEFFDYPASHPCASADACSFRSSARAGNEK